MQLSKDFIFSSLCLIVGIIIGIIGNDQYHYNKQSEIELENLNKFIIQKNKNKVKIDSLENVLLGIKVQKIYKQIIKEEELCN